MAKVYSPNKEYTGVSAGVPFAGGVGRCDDERLLDWFRKHGYKVEGDTVQDDTENPAGTELPNGQEQSTDQETSTGTEQPTNTESLDDVLAKMNEEELRKYAADNGVFLGNAKTVEGICKKIKEGLAQA